MVQKYRSFYLRGEFAYWWSCIGKGLRLQPAQQACLMNYWTTLLVVKSLPSPRSAKYCKINLFSLIWDVRFLMSQHWRYFREVGQRIESLNPIVYVSESALLGGLLDHGCKLLKTESAVTVVSLCHQLHPGLRLQGASAPKCRDTDKLKLIILIVWSLRGNSFIATYRFFTGTSPSGN